LHKSKGILYINSKYESVPNVPKLICIHSLCCQACLPPALSLFRSSHCPICLFYFPHFHFQLSRASCRQSFRSWLKKIYVSGRAHGKAIPSFSTPLVAHKNVGPPTPIGSLPLSTQCFAWVGPIHLAIIHPLILIFFLFFFLLLFSSSHQLNRFPLLSHINLITRGLLVLLKGGKPASSSSSSLPPSFLC
jgi:hypothetical protein